MHQKIKIFALFLLMTTSYGVGLEEPLNPVSKELPKAFQPAEPGELAGLENLIAATQNSLNEQLALHELIQNYLREQARFLETPNNKDQLLKTARLARRTLETIKEQHLMQVFDAKFISELTLFAKIAKKPSIPKA